MRNWFGFYSEFTIKETHFVVKLEEILTFDSVESGFEHVKIDSDGYHHEDKHTHDLHLLSQHNLFAFSCSLYAVSIWIKDSQNTLHHHFSNNRPEAITWLPVLIESSSMQVP